MEPVSGSAFRATPGRDLDEAAAPVTRDLLGRAPQSPCHPATSSQVEDQRGGTSRGSALGHQRDAVQGDHPRAVSGTQHAVVAVEHGKAALNSSVAAG